MSVEYVLMWKNIYGEWMCASKSSKDDFHKEITISNDLHIPWKVIRREITVKETVVRESQ